MRKFFPVVLLSVATIVFGLTGFVLLQRTYALAVPTPIPNTGEGWAGDWSCGNNGLSFKNAGNLMQIPYSNKQDAFLKNYPDKCIFKGKLGGINDLTDCATASTGKEIVFCADPTTSVGKRNEDLAYTEYNVVWPLCAGATSGSSRSICCPYDHPVVVDDKTLGVWTHYRCCTGGGATSHDLCGDGTPGVPPTDFSITEITDSNYFFDATEVYTCPMDACLMSPDVNTQAPNSQSRTNLNKADIIGSKLFCEKSNETAKMPGSDYYCIQGTILDQDTYDQWKSQLTEYVACKAFIDTSEGQACLDCLKGHASRVYSSLGCIDTEQNALIIRIMQIGIGIVGGIGIFRLMQAAILRQTADPAKIQESWDIISSVIIGLIILLGSIVILRVIGINVLGILPLDF